MILVAFTSLVKYLILQGQKTIILKRITRWFTVTLVLGLALASCVNRIEPLEDTWESAVPFQPIPQGLVSIRSADCGVCHKEIYQEWLKSTHAHAWTDLQFQSEIKKESSPYLCINCHIPLENQQEYLITGLKNGDIYQPVKEKNPHFDAAMQLEGIGCATCHVRDGFIIGTRGTVNAPHPVRVDSSFLSEQLCITCHNANAVVTPELVCTFQTGEEWQVGPYAQTQTCISCHMDTLTRSWMSGMPEHVSHRHWFPGSGIPKQTGETPVALEGLDFKPDTLEPTYSGADSIHYSLTLTNAHAGHRLPTGDPERYYLIDLTWLNAATSDTIAHRRYRIGEVWEWYPVAKKISDNNLDPLESRTYTIGLLPSEEGTYTLHTKVTKHRMTEETAAYHHLTEDYPTFITVFTAEQAVTVN